MYKITTIVLLKTTRNRKPYHIRHLLRQYTNKNTRQQLKRMFEWNVATKVNNSSIYNGCELAIFCWGLLSPSRCLALMLESAIHGAQRLLPQSPRHPVLTWDLGAPSAVDVMFMANTVAPAKRVLILVMIEFALSIHILWLDLLETWSRMGTVSSAAFLLWLVQNRILRRATHLLR